MFSRFGWVCACVAAAVVACAAPAAHGQDAPTAAQLLTAFKYVTGRVSREADAVEKPVDASLQELAAKEEVVPDAPGAGVCVSLRLHQREVGRGVSMERTPSLRLAAEQAITAARAAQPGARDMLQRAAQKEFWKGLTAGVELAGPLVETDIATFSDADGRVMVGVEGVAVRLGARTEAVFPSQMLVANDTAAGALIGLVSRISGDPTLAMPGVPGHDAGDLSRTKDIHFYKFRVLHAVQMAPDGVAVPLTRGGRIVLGSEITTPAMREFAVHLSENLLAQRTSVEGRDELFAAYWPLQDRSEGIASVREKALTCLALCEGARLTARPDGTGSDLPAPVAAAQELLIPMLSIDGRLPDSELTPAAAAMVVAAMSELCAWTGRPKGDWFQPAHHRLAVAVQSAVDDAGVWNDRTRAAERSIVSLALVQLASDPVMGTATPGTPPAIAARARASGAVRALFRETPPGSLVMHMPWLARAELALAGAGDIPSVAALRQMRDTAWQMQVGDLEASMAGNDVAGGLMLANASGDALPTAQSARAFAYLATALHDKRLTDDAERPAQTSRMLRSLRFLRQLSLDDSWDWCVADPQRARWGVRAAVTDQRQSLDATAMTLITVSGLLRGFDK